VLAEHIHDNRFLRLLRNMLQAGYLEDWEWNATLSGAPQGGVCTPPTHLATSRPVTLHVGTGGRCAVSRRSLAKWYPVADCNLLGSDQNVLDKQP
jgi:hypothetical protein